MTERLSEETRGTLLEPLFATGWAIEPDRDAIRKQMEQHQLLVELKNKLGVAARFYRELDLTHVLSEGELLREDAGGGKPVPMGKKLPDE